MAWYVAPVKTSTPADGSDSGPLPTPLVAWTVNVYVTPLERPLIVQLSPPLWQVRPPGELVTV